MSVMNDAQQIVAMGETAHQSIAGPANNAKTSVTGADAATRQAVESGYEVVQQVSLLLGEGHIGVTAVEGACAFIAEAAEKAQATLAQALIDLDAVIEAAGTFKFVLENVGGQLMQGGGS